MNSILISIIIIICLGTIITTSYTFADYITNEKSGIFLITTSAYAEEDWKVYEVTSKNLQLYHGYAQNKIFKIFYKTSHANIKNVTVGSVAIQVELTNATEGNLEIKIPRNLYPSKIHENGSSVSIDGEEVRHEESGTDCFRAYTIPFPNDAKTIGIHWMLEPAEHPLSPHPIPPECASEIMIENTLPPLKQVANGIKPSDVICKEGLQLIFKSKDNSPACVKPQTAEKLVERGWGTLTSMKESISKEEAVKSLESYYGADKSNYINVDFVFLKYNGTWNDNPQFIMYPADPSTKTIGIQWNHTVTFDEVRGYLYSQDKQSDRFAWDFTTVGVPSPSHYFVNAKTGEVIGTWNSCPMCICHHENKTDVNKTNNEY